MDHGEIPCGVFCASLRLRVACITIRAPDITNVVRGKSSGGTQDFLKDISQGAF
jgi:hypothetical protein